MLSSAHPSSLLPTHTRRDRPEGRKMFYQVVMAVPCALLCSGLGPYSHSRAARTVLRGRGGEKEGGMKGEARLACLLHALAWPAWTGGAVIRLENSDEWSGINGP